MCESVEHPTQRTILIAEATHKTKIKCTLCKENMEPMEIVYE